MRALDRAKKDEREEAKELGHELGRFHKSKDGNHIAQCKHCDYYTVIYWIPGKLVNMPLFGFNEWVDGFWAMTTMHPEVGCHNG